MRENLLEFLSQRGTLVEPEAADFLLRMTDPVRAARSLLDSLGEAPLILTLAQVQQAVEIARTAAESRVWRESTPLPVPTVAVPRSFARASDRAADVGAEIRIVRDITGRSTCEGTIEDFSKYFRHRFRTLSKMLRSRRELVGAVEITKATRYAREVKFIGMVSAVRSVRNGGRILEVEDDVGTATVLLPGDSALASETVLPDEVVGVVGTANDRGLVIAKSLVRPDIPVAREWRGPQEHVRVAFASDIHVGSKTFLADRWAKLDSWLASGDEVARSIRYLVVSGDLVDGIGVYPRQDEDLAIDDIYAQYESAARLFAALPDWIHVVLIPGNHDAVRPAEPQPALPVAVQKLFDSRVTFAGNPSAFTVHGVRVLAYHGRSMDDFVSSVPFLNYANPLDAMREMLKKRHLAPTYGGKTPIAPESEDYLIVDEVPDVFVTGHVHGCGVGEYRGVVLVNSSTWQAQTSYQKMRNIDPRPAQLPIVDLATGEAVVRPF